MRPFRNLALALLLLGALASSRIGLGDEYGRDGNLEIWIRTDKPVYEPGEPIFVTFILKNRTSETLTINRRWELLREIDLEVFKDSEGAQTFRPAKPARPFQKNDFVQVAPGKDLEMRLEINERLPDPLGPGSFALRGSYQNEESGKTFGLEAWTGKIFSNQVNIRVKSALRM